MLLRFIFVCVNCFVVLSGEFASVLYPEDTQVSGDEAQASDGFVTVPV